MYSEHKHFILGKALTITLFLQGSYLEIKKQMDKLDPLAHPLLQW